MYTPHHVSHVTCHVSCVTCHVSHVRCHMSGVTIFFFFFFLVVKLIGGGSFFNGAYPDQFKKNYLQFSAFQLVPYLRHSCWVTKALSYLWIDLSYLNRLSDPPLKTLRELQNTALRTSHQWSMCQVVFTKLWHYYYRHNHYCHIFLGTNFQSQN